MQFVALGKVAVAAPGTPVRLSADRVQCVRIVIQQNPANAGSTYIGDESLDVATGAGLARVLSGPSDGMVMPGEPNANMYRLSDYWLDADTAGDSVLVSYWVL